MPYIVLEAVAAAMPMVATRVGGIPEIFGAESRAAWCRREMPMRWQLPWRGLRDAPRWRAPPQSSCATAIRKDFSVDAMAARLEAVYRALTTTSK